MYIIGNERDYNYFNPTKYPTFSLLIPYLSPTKMRIKYEGPTFSQKGPTFEKYSATIFQNSPPLWYFSFTFGRE